MPDESETWPDADWEQLTDYLGGDASPATIAATERRLATDPAFARLAAPLLTIRNTPLPVQSRDLAAAWAAVERKADVLRLTHATPDISATSPALPLSPAALPLRRWNINPVWTIVAVALVILGTTTFYILDRPRERALQYYIAIPASHTIHLADGSSVTLATGATLVADGISNGDGTHAPPTRTVHLDGTGTFFVRADPAHPFIVETHGVSAVAIGTAFRVADRENGAGNTTSTPASSSSQSAAVTAVHISVINGKVVVQRQTTPGHHETVAVLGPGQETSVQTFARYFKAGWVAAAAHKSIAEAYLEDQAMQAADSARAAAHHPSP